MKADGLTELDKHKDGRRTPSDAERRRRSEQMKAINAERTRRRDEALAAGSPPKGQNGHDAHVEIPKRVNLRRDVEWVFHALGGASVANPPSPGALWLYRWAQGSPDEFFRTLLPRMMDKGEDEEVKRQRRMD